MRNPFNQLPPQKGPNQLIKNPINSLITILPTIIYSIFDHFQLSAETRLIITHSAYYIKCDSL